MKLTWFGQTAFRIHIGGEIVVIDADLAPVGVDRNELVSGADHVIALDGEHPAADGQNWRPRPRERLLDAGEATRPVQYWALGHGGLVIDADEDMPLLVLAGPVPTLGRWAERAVLVLAGDRLAPRATALADALAPRLIALAGDEDEVDAAFAALRSRLDGTGLLALERGLAVEA